MRDDDEGNDLTPEEMKAYQEWAESNEHLARDFAIVYIGYQMGVTFRTAEKYYGKQKPGNFWLSIADLVNRTIHSERYQTVLMELLRDIRSDSVRRGN